MKKVRLGIIGLGSMGAAHAQWILAGKTPRIELAAVADIDPVFRKPFAQIRSFADGSDLIKSGFVDAVLIATPHYSHTTLGIQAFKAGLHVLVEKPISVHKADCLRLIAAAKSAKRGGRRAVFAAMFNQRTNPHYRKLRELLQGGELGEIQRIQWTVTNWFRSQAYYSSGGWRATWAGEGGGMLLNQCPHNLDLLQWLFGMPDSVTAFCEFGRYHAIEVEDSVTAYLQYKNGPTATFIAATGEAPGTNRLEIACDRGRVVLENGKIEFTRTVVPVGEYSRTTPERWSTPEVWNVKIATPGADDQHVGILNNFADAVLDGAPLIAPGEEGMYSVELANAMLLSTFERKTIGLPLNAARYEKALKKKTAASKFKKRVVKSVPVKRDLNNSFGKL
jgi:predicted dehydrogenase